MPLHIRHSRNNIRGKNTPPSLVKDTCKTLLSRSRPWTVRNRMAEKCRSFLSFEILNKSNKSFPINIPDKVCSARPRPLTALWRQRARVSTASRDFLLESMVSMVTGGRLLLDFPRFWGSPVPISGWPSGSNCHVTTGQVNGGNKYFCYRIENFIFLDGSVHNPDVLK